MVAVIEDEWDGKERRTAFQQTESSRRAEDKIELTESTLGAYEERLKWEISELYGELQATQKTKFFVINFSVSVFPIIVSVIVAVYAYFGETEGKIYHHEMVTGFFMLILMAAGSSNMVVIKYIAALKSNAMLVMRQITCLRHALDSISFFQFQNGLPGSSKVLRNEGTAYWAVFGRHRKLPIGNAGFRRHFVFQSYQSADMIIMTYLFLLSALLLLSPSFYLVYRGYEKVIEIGALVSLFASVALIKLFFIISFFMALTGIFFYIKNIIPKKIKHIEDETFSEIRDGEEIDESDKKYVVSLKLMPNTYEWVLLLPPVFVFISLITIGIGYSGEEFITLLCFMSILGISLICLSFYIVYIDSIRRIMSSAISRQTEQDNIEQSNEEQGSTKIR